MHTPNQQVSHGYLAELPSWLTKYFQAGNSSGCFFDSIAQGLKRLAPDDKSITAKSLRRFCKAFTEGNDEVKKKVIQDARNTADSAILGDVSDEELWNGYLNNIEYTNDDIERIRNDNPPLYQSLTKKYGGVPILGKPDIEGQLICDNFLVDGIKLYVIESASNAVLLIKPRSKPEPNSVLKNNDNAIYIVNKGNGNFEPLLRKQEISQLADEVQTPRRSERIFAKNPTPTSEQSCRKRPGTKRKRTSSASSSIVTSPKANTADEFVDQIHRRLARRSSTASSTDIKRLKFDQEHLEEKESNKENVEQIRSSVAEIEPTRDDAGREMPILQDSKQQPPTYMQVNSLEHLDVEKDFLNY